MRWNSPEFILLLLLIPLVGWYRLYLSRTLKRGGIRFAQGFTLAAGIKSWKVRLAFIPDLMRSLVLLLLVFALMQPQYGQEHENVTRQGIDIMIALDVSGSMAAEDFKPNRIKAAQKITENFIGGITDHRIGLVVFAGLALTQCPLTIDYGVVTELLRELLCKCSNMTAQLLAMPSSTLSTSFHLKAGKSVTRWLFFSVMVRITLA